MSVTDAAVHEAGPLPTTSRVVNDFAIHVATVNERTADREQPFEDTSPTRCNAKAARFKTSEV